MLPRVARVAIGIEIIDIFRYYRRRQNRPRGRTGSVMYRPARCLWRQQGGNAGSIRRAVVETQINQRFHFVLGVFGGPSREVPLLLRGLETLSNDGNNSHGHDD